MRLPILLTLLPAFLPWTARAQLDLTPRPSHYEVEGIQFPCVEFQFGRNTVSYSPPRGWKSIGDNQRCTLRPAEADGSGAQILQVPLPAELRGTTELQNGNFYRDRALEQVPKAGLNPRILSVQKSDLQIRGRPTLEVTLEYDYLARKETQSVIFFLSGEIELRFCVFAKSADFPAVRSQFFESLFSLQGL